MRIFNRLIAVIVLAGLFIGGFFAVIYGFNLLGYSVSDLERQLDLSGRYESLQSFVEGVETGNLTNSGIAILIAVALVGLILLTFELKPRRPRRVRMQKGTYVTRNAVSNEVEVAAEDAPNVLGSSVRVKAKRRPGALVNVRADVRAGEDQKTIRNDIKGSVQEKLARIGIPLGKLRIDLVESDPRTTKTRVR